jgi:hypothetical protein
MTSAVSFPSFIVCRIFPFPLTLRSISIYFTQQIQTISSILLQHHISNFPDISGLISEVFKFQQTTKECSKCSTSVVASSNVIPMYWWKSLLLVECCFFHSRPDWSHMYTLRYLLVLSGYKSHTFHTKPRGFQSSAYFYPKGFHSWTSAKLGNLAQNWMSLKGRDI